MGGIRRGDRRGHRRQSDLQPFFRGQDARHDAAACGDSGVILSSTAVIGDLIESIFKREAGVKDSGNFFPGIGGIPRLAGQPAFPMRPSCICICGVRVKSAVRNLRFAIYDLRAQSFPISLENPANKSMTRGRHESANQGLREPGGKALFSTAQQLDCPNWGNSSSGSGTSVGANYRAVCRAKSNADFVNKLRIVEEECTNPYFGWKLLVETT